MSEALNRKYLMALEKISVFEERIAELEKDKAKAKELFKTLLEAHEMSSVDFAAMREVEKFITTD